MSKKARGQESGSRTSDKGTVWWIQRLSASKVSPGLWEPITHLVDCRSDRFYSDPGNRQRAAVGLSRIYPSLYVHSQPCSALQKQDTLCLWLRRGNQHLRKTRCPSRRSMVVSEITAAWLIFQLCFAFCGANAIDILCYRIFHHRDIILEVVFWAFISSIQNALIKFS